jgi:predicted nucleotidyltransferase
MTHKTFRITGRVIDQTGQGVEGLRIEAWDKDLFFDDFVGSEDETGSEGSFEIKFKESYFKEIFARRPDLYFKIFRQDELIPGAEFEIEVQLPTGKIRKGSGNAVFCKVASGTTNVTIKLQTPAGSQLFKVLGRVLEPDGRPVVGATVKTFDKDLRHEQFLNETTTNQNGCYEIRYTADQFRRAEKKTADLIVRAYDPQGTELASSSIIFNAPTAATIDIKADSVLSEFERLLNELGPLLKIDNVILADLTEDDVAFLAGETGFKEEWLQILADAARLASQIDFDLSEDDETAVFYGLGRKGQPMVLDELLSRDFFVLRKVLEVALDKNIIPHYLSASMDVIFEALDQLADASAQEKPIYYIDVQQKRLRSIGDFIGMDPAKMNTLINRAVTFAGVNDTTLGSLVEEGELQEQEAEEVGLAVSLYHLLDADMQLTEAVKSGTFPQLPQGSLSHIEDLVAFDKGDWLAILSQAGTTPPNGLTREEYAAILTKKIEKLYPSDALLARLIRTDDEALRKNIEILQPLFEKNETIFGIDGFKKLTIEGSQPDEVEKLRDTHDALTCFIKNYKGLNLEEILDNRELSVADKVIQINESISLFSKFKSQNSDKEFLSLDYSPESADVTALDFSGFADDEQQMVLSSFKAHQRIYSISEDIEQSQLMMAAGYDSAWKIAGDSQENFLANTGLSVAAGVKSYDAALATVGKTTIQIGSVLDVVQGGFDSIDVSNQSPDINDYLKKIDGFEELFGSQDYCKCEHCQSILSPAAYFVDLMSFVEEKILSTNFSGDLQDHVLNLKTRRRDLWELQLTCENTHGLIPYLDIINEILENYIYVTGHAIDEEELPERSIIEHYVYNQIIYNSVNSFQQPALLPLEKLEIYLSHFDVTRGEIATLLEEESDVIAAAVLKLSGDEYELVTQPNDDLDFLKDLYGIEFVIDPHTGCINEFDAQDLLSPMGLTRSELGKLVKTQFIRSSSPGIIQIKGEKTDDDESESVQNDIERIYGLYPASLDCMHRFIRLWRKLSWSISELDLVLSHWEEEGLALGIDENTPQYLVTLLTIQDRFRISVEALCTLWSNIPQRKISDSNEALFDRLFNLPDFVLLDGEYPPEPPVKFIHPAFLQSVPATPVDNALHRLLAGLRIDDEQIYLLITYLSSPLGLDLSPENEEDKKGFYLTVGNLSLLYRHARLAQWLKITITQLFQLISHVESISSNYIDNLSDLSALLAHYDWWKSTDYTLDDLDFIMGKQVIDSGAYPDGTTIAEQMLGEIKSDDALTFADTVFAYLAGITEEQSRIIILTNAGWITAAPDENTYWLSNSFDPNSFVADPKAALTFADTIFSFLEGVTEEQSLSIITANTTVIEAIPDGTAYRLSEHFDPDVPLVIPENIPVIETDARELLLAYFNVSKADVSSLLQTYHAKEIVPTYLSGKFGTAVAKIKEFVKMADVDMADPNFVSALQGTAPIAEIVNLVKKLLPLSILFREKIFDTDSLDFIAEYKDKPGLFVISDFNALSIQNIQRVALYGSFLRNVEDQASRDNLKSVLLAFDPGLGFTNVDNELADVLKAEIGLIITLVAQLSLPSTALEALDKLRRCVEMVKYLEVGGEALNLLVSEDYNELAQASDAILGAFRAKYDDEDEWKEKIEPFENKIRTRKRDILTDFIIHSAEHPWCNSRSDLYYYFLIDVELEGCARTSKVVAAISSVQLYVHRCLLNLEQDNAGNVHVLPKDIPRDEWAWRKNYRVWEANRKVFLYPENWIEPELRDNKTPLFEALESELLQQEINEQTVLDAYANYMRGFEEVSHLKIAGSYHEKDKKNKTDILHLFGVTSDEPPIYYYRAIENAHYGEREQDRGVVWSPWRKIDVQIPVNKVSPIVFRGRLHVFWVEFTTRPKNEVKDGGSEFVGYQHKMSLKYTNLRLDGTWTTPQRISFYGVHPFDKGDGVIEDPLYEPGEGTLLWKGNQEDVDGMMQFLQSMYPGFKLMVQYAENGQASIILSFLPASFDIPKYDNVVHLEPKDGYTLSGYRWDQVYPAIWETEDGDEQLVITGRDWEMASAPIDFYKRAIKSSYLDLFDEDSEDEIGFFFYRILYSRRNKLYYLCPVISFLDNYAYSSLLVEFKRLGDLYQRISDPDLKNYIDTIRSDLIESGTNIATLNENDELAPVNGSIQDIIIDSNGDLLILQSLIRKRATHLLRRLGTTLSEQIARALLTQGVDGLLSLDMQKGLVEKPSPINKSGSYIDDIYIEDAITSGKPDFKGSFGTYFREIFFHMPFLIANHLNSQQKFAEAQKWYHYIFDPTADEEIDIFGSGSTPTPEEASKKQQDRNWRYIEFRDFNIDKLRDQLNDENAIEAYKSDPFNPHAIARLRLSAYQKTIVMKYIDNLLDWGDQLFTQDTMESINEATLLYVLASDILGERPAELGECTEIPIESRTYESIKPSMNEDSPFLIEMEHLTATSHIVNFASVLKSNYRYVIDPVLASNVSASAFLTTTGSGLAAQPFSVSVTDDTGTDPVATDRASETAMMDTTDQAVRSVGLSLGIDWNQAKYQIHQKYHPKGWLELVRQISPVFCVPENKGLRQYWDRVEDRLYKIQNCMNISGIRRALSLFAPEIDPGLMVRAKAAGLSVEDVLNAISGNLPPYRFAYVIEKAKSYAATVQGFGASLLSALEKKDVEELTLLRTVHEQNIMKMTKQVKLWEIDAANETIEALKRKEETVQHRRNYYQSLIDEGRTPLEITQAVAQHGAAGLRGLAASFNTYGAIAYLVPQVGSPFAMKYGGKEQGDSGSSWSEVFRALAEISDTVATSAGFEANLERRDQGWAHQLEQADHELKELEKQIKGAEIHKDLTKRSLELHEKSLEQLNEVYEFYGEKFSNLGLYTWLSTTLQRLYRKAYNSAYSMAKLAEQAYRFERSDNSSELLGSGHWEASKAGLLAGERLIIDLQNLERRFIETNYRSLEINQSFSLTQIAPTALIQLRETGSCEFDISEIFFDLFYPGHYRRKIKSVRLTIPCVTGPYTNVSATLTLVGSSIRVEPKVDENELKPVPRTRTLSIATSSAQNDAGVFELNFRDERYMPFEGAGAISRWKLSLPKNYRQFDYQTISDVLIHVSYTAEEDGVLREKIENINAVTEGSILEFLREHSLPRVFSFRHDFSNEFHRLLHSPIGKSVMIELTDKHFPIFLKGKSIQVKKAMFILGTPKDQSITDFEISINGASHTAADFTRYARHGDLWSKDLNSLFSSGVLGEHTFIIKDAGDLVPDSPAPSDPSAIDSEKLTDIYLYLEYGIN